MVFIVIDGIDGSGKKTQLDLLVKRIQSEGYDIKIVDFPQYGKKSAALVEEYLNGRFGSADEVSPYQASIFFACDRFEAKKRMTKWLSEGKILLSNRYVSANMGHQGGKVQDEERERLLNWLDELEFGIFAIPRPDLTIILDIPVEISQQLVGKKEKRIYTENTHDIHESDACHLENARKTYLNLVKKPGWTLVSCAKQGHLRAPEEIAKEIWDKVSLLILTNPSKNQPEHY